PRKQRACSDTHNTELPNYERTLTHGQVYDFKILEIWCFQGSYVRLYIINIRQSGNRLLRYQSFIIDSHELKNRKMRSRRSQFRYLRSARPPFLLIEYRDSYLFA